MVKMKLKTTKKILNLVLFGIMIMCLSSFVSAFGVGFPGSKLSLVPGQDFEGAFGLQNTEGVDLVINISVEKGAEYITFLEGTVFNLPKEGNIAVPVKIDVPENAEVGSKYVIEVLFRVVAGLENKEGEGGMIGFAMGQSRIIEVEIIEQPKAEGEATETPAPIGNFVIGAGWIILVVILVIAIIFVGYLVIKNKKKKSRK